MDVRTANIILKVSHNTQARRKECVEIVGEAGVQIAEKILREGEDFNIKKDFFGSLFLELSELNDVIHDN